MVALGSGAQRASGDQSVVLVLHAANQTIRFGWRPEIADALGELLIEQADRVERP